MHALHTLDVQFKLVTPCFSGVEAQRAEIRVPSLMGMIRFWWRALAWGRTTSLGDDNKRLAKVHAWEADLFGSTAGQRLLVRLSKNETRRQGSEVIKRRDLIGGYAWRNFSAQNSDQKRDAPTLCSGLAYLAGQGLVGSQDTVNDHGRTIPAPTDKDPGAQRTSWFDLRESMAPGGTFTLSFRAAPGNRLNARQVDAETGTAPPSLLDALKAVGLLGCLGSRARRGFGSLHLDYADARGVLDDATAEALGNLPTPDDRDNYIADLGTLFALGGASEPNAPYSVINEACDAVLISSRADGRELAKFHDAVGEGFRSFRSWYPEIYNNPPKGRFEFDHQWFKALPGKGISIPRDRNGFIPLLTNTKPTYFPKSAYTFPERAVFGLPYPMGKAQVVPDHAELERRASPLLLRILDFGAGQFGALWLHMPGIFLPEAVALKIKSSGNRNQNIAASEAKAPGAVNPDIITAFLDYAAGVFGTGDDGRVTIDTAHNGKRRAFGLKTPRQDWASAMAERIKGGQP